MKFLESDLEQIIMKSSNEELRNKGLPIYGLKKNQLRIGFYGIADVVTFSRIPVVKENKISHIQELITVYELKKDNVSLSSFAQGLNYIKGIQEYFSGTFRDPDLYFWQLVLVGRNIETSSSVCYIPDLFYKKVRGGVFVNNYTYDYNIDGLKFKDESGYRLTNNGFGL